MSELNETIKQVIEGEDVALFMKGTPQMIMCGNSLRALIMELEGLSEDQIFELVVCAAIGQATRQYQSALGALAEAVAHERR